MAKAKKALVVGASGLVGSAIVKQFCAAGCEVVAVSRRPPLDCRRADFVSLDLLDDEACRKLFSTMSDVTHLVYAALHERPTLVAGWRDSEQIGINQRMFRNVLDPIIAASGGIRHITLLQGTKAYGVHVRPLKVPAREGRDELRSQENFYWRQEDHLRAMRRGAAWNWTILRPVLVVGEAIGSAMNVIAAIGVFAALLNQDGLPVAYPGGGSRVGQAVDADLLARAVVWSGEADAARDDVFNVTNGDVFVWENVWPAIVEALGGSRGSPESRSLQQYCQHRLAAWDQIRKQHALLSPSVEQFVGASFEYCDYLLRFGQTDPGPPSIVSTVKIQSAGFNDVMDTEAMFRKWIRTYQKDRLLPPAAAG